MAKKLSYAGITLPLATPQLSEWLDQVHPQTTFHNADFWNFDNLMGSLPTPSIPRPPKLEFGVLHWPSDASRPAWFHAVVNRQRLDQIRAVVSNPMTPQSLVMYDGRHPTTPADYTITASMYMLPARPLNQLGHASSDAWVLTLTDIRFFWYWKRGIISAQPLAWANLYGSIAEILGTGIDDEAVDSDYGTPSAKWIGYYQAGGVLLDSVAKQVGQRVVVNLDGTVKTVNWGTAKAASNAYSVNAATEISGGELAIADIGRYVPSSINVLFIDATSAPPSPAPHVVSKSLAGLNVSGYGNASGITGFSEVVYADIPYTGTNASAVNNYATQASYDWYGWTATDLDIVYPGIEPWVPTGWEDSIEWTLQKREGQPFSSTHVRRGPFLTMPSGDWFAGLTPESPAQQASGADCAPGCGWIAGMASGWCMFGSVISNFGQCSGINNSQQFHMRYATATNKWVSKIWDDGTEDWIDHGFIYGSGASGTLKTWLDKTTTDRIGIAASINDINLVLDCCGTNYAVFSFGNAIDPAFCSGGIPTYCEPNVARVKVECDCCSMAGWEGEGWYCILDLIEDCGVDAPVVVELLEEDRCRTDIQICLGRYATQAEAEAACGTATGGTCATCTGGSRALNAVLQFVVNTQGTINMVWDGSTYWVGSANLACGLTYARFSDPCGGAILETSEDGIMWFASGFVSPPVVACDGSSYSVTDGAGGNTYRVTFGSAVGCAGQPGYVIEP